MSQAQTVLVVEDEVSIASFISLYLKNAGYRVKAVGSGGDALAQLEVEQPALIHLRRGRPGAARGGTARADHPRPDASGHGRDGCLPTDPAAP